MSKGLWGYVEKEEEGEHWWLFPCVINYTSTDAGFCLVLQKNNCGSFHYFFDFFTAL